MWGRMNWIVNGTKIPIRENIRRSLHRIVTDSCTSDTHSFFLKITDEQKSLLDKIRVKVCVTTKYDHEFTERESSSLLMDEIAKNSKELYGFIKYHPDAEDPFIYVALLIDFKSLITCSRGVYMMETGKAYGFKLHLEFEPKYDYSVRNEDFDFNEFMNGKCYFIEGIVYQVMKNNLST